MIALHSTRHRCWKFDWVLEFDVRGMFDNIDHGLLMKAVRKHTKCKWTLLYIERWLKAASQDQEGKIISRTVGVPQGGVISSVLSNLFMHYVFDIWMTIQHPDLPFCRYADDGLIHCRSNSEAEKLKVELSQRFAQCKLELHPVKTKIVNCKASGKITGEESAKFDFLGYQFRRRLVRAKSAKVFVGFTPAISPDAATAIRKTIRSWELSRRTHLDIKDLAKQLNPIIRGWVQYYEKFNRSELYKVLRYLDLKLLGWVKRKYKKHGSYTKRPKEWLGKVSSMLPNLFAHWRFVNFSG